MIFAKLGSQFQLIYCSYHMTMLDQLRLSFFSFLCSLENHELQILIGKGRMYHIIALLVVIRMTLKNFETIFSVSEKTV